VVGQEVEHRPDGEDRIVVLPAAGGKGQRFRKRLQRLLPPTRRAGRTCSGANALKRSISPSPSRWPLVTTIGSVWVEPWTTRWATTLMSVLSSGWAVELVRSERRAERTSESGGKRDRVASASAWNQKNSM
jgi:hypothetical protein